MTLSWGLHCGWVENSKVNIIFSQTPNLHLVSKAQCRSVNYWLLLDSILAQLDTIAIPLNMRTTLKFEANMFFIGSTKGWWIVVGGLFEEANSMEEIAFKYAVDHINRNKLLPKSRVMAQIERIPSHDSFYASKRGLFRWWGVNFLVRIF